MARITNAALQARIDAQSEALTALMEQVGALTALLSEQQVAAASNPKPTKSAGKKAAAQIWAAKLPAKYSQHKDTPQGEALVLSATVDRTWTWVTFSDVPTAELSESIKAAAKAVGCKAAYAKSRNAWYFQAVCKSPADFVGKLGRYASTIS